MESRDVSERRPMDAIVVETTAKITRTNGVNPIKQSLLLTLRSICVCDMRSSTHIPPGWHSWNCENVNKLFNCDPLCVVVLSLSNRHTNLSARVNGHEWKICSSFFDLLAVVCCVMTAWTANYTHYGAESWLLCRVLIEMVWSEKFETRKTRVNQRRGRHNSRHSHTWSSRDAKSWKIVLRRSVE